jgi:23S rRNA pseudouridine2457 synthase
MKYVLFNKPFNVLSQFTSNDRTVPLDQTLSFYKLPKNVYSCGRLDKDSEGLLLLTDDGKLIERYSHPRFHWPKTYWVQVERVPNEDALNKLRSGLKIQDYETKSCQAKIIDDPNLGERSKPVRFRKNVATCWLEIIISEGKNRQIRRMTASIGHPTLRLFRFAIGHLNVKGLAPGQSREISDTELDIR